jgi:hypothetical protein
MRAEGIELEASFDTEARRQAGHQPTSLSGREGGGVNHSMIEVPGQKTLFAGQLDRFTLKTEAEQDVVAFRAIQVRPSI